VSVRIDEASTDLAPCTQHEQGDLDILDFTFVEAGSTVKDLTT
jgi:hypothetical protein